MEKKKTECTIKIPVDVAGLDCAIEKAKQILYRVPTKIEFEVNGTEKALPETEQRAGDE